MTMPWIVLTTLSLVMPMVQPVPFTPIASGVQSGIEERREAVARTAAEWSALWKAHAPDQPPPKVDFTKSMAIAVFLGTRPTAGVRLEITGIARDGEALTVTYRERGPGAGEMAAQMLTMPFVIVTTERASGTVRFVRAK